jgi:imidazolonepropionase-like amidohydrolase/Tol biopolymer transport system component
MRRPRLPVAFGIIFLLIGSNAPSRAVGRTLEFRTKEVTDPGVSVSPDGRDLVFSVLGHLFRIPVEGGAAEQLTLGSSYDSEPAYSPDGRRVAFVSDRDGSAGNIFVLDLSTRAISQLTHESQSAQPVWSPDGRSVAYCRVLAREEHPARLLPRFFGSSGLREVRRVSVPEGKTEVVAAPRTIGSVFFLRDGRLAWTVIEQTSAPGSPFPGRASAKFEVLGPDGKAVTLRALLADPGRVVVSPAGDGLYGSAGGLQFVPLAEGAARPIPGISGGRAGGMFAISPDNKSAFMGQDGQLVRLTIATAARQVIPFDANVKTDVRDPVRARWTPPRSNASPRFRSVMSPQLSPDGTRLVFMAAGELWQQPLAGGQAEPLLADRSLYRDPALGPDGRTLAFARDKSGRRQLSLYDVVNRQVKRSIDLGDRAWGLLSSWSRDGQRVIFQQSDALFTPLALMTLAVNDGPPKKLGDATSAWTARPQFAPDGQAIYYTGRVESLGTLYRLPLTVGAKPEAVTELTGHVNDALVSPDGKWVAFRRNAEIWVAALGSGTIKDDQVRRFSPEGGRNFSFTPDSTALVYAAGPRVWRQPLGGGTREEIVVRAEPRRTEPRTVLFRRVRVLDFNAKAFGSETSLLTEGGSIKWIGSEKDHSVPESASVVDCGGRYAIPGLFDLHVHAAWSNFEASPDAFIAYGVTSVRDTGGRLDLLGTLADRGDLSPDPLPRYFYSGDIFEGARPNWGDAFLQITREDEARAHVRLWREHGAHFIKVYPSLPWPLQRAVADEAHKVGLPMVGHGLSTDEIVKSVNLGYAVLEHGPSAIYDDMLKLLAAAGTRWDPTLAILGGHGLIIRDEPGRLEEAAFRAFVPEPSIREAKGGGMFGRMPDQMLRAAWKARLARVRAAGEAGVRLQAGTDSLMTGTFFGPSLHWELEHFAEAGIAPLDVIRMATSSAAEAVGAGDQLGSLDPGKLADLVLLDANPLENIRNTRSIWRVVKGGVMFDPTRLRSEAKP